MTDPDDVPGVARSHGKDLFGGTDPGTPPRAGEEPTVPFTAFPAPGARADSDEPTRDLGGRRPGGPGSAPGTPEVRHSGPSAAGPARSGTEDTGTEQAPAGREHVTDVAGEDRERVTDVAGEDLVQVADGEAAPGVPHDDLDREGPEEEPAGPAGESPDLSISGKPEGDRDRPRIRRPAPAGTLIWVLLALLGFTLVVQLRSNDADDGLAATRQEDLVRILSDLESEDSRLLTQIQELEQSKQDLNSKVGGREAAVEEAARRSQELGLLAGTVAGRGPGLDITLTDVEASDILNTVQELRGAGGEVMQLNGANGAAVRLVASSFFVDATGGGVIADGERLSGPFHLLVIGPASTMSTALQIPGGVVASAKSDGGSVTMDSRSLVEVTALRKATALRYARPVS